MKRYAIAVLLLACLTGCADSPVHSAATVPAKYIKPEPRKLRDLAVGQKAWVSPGAIILLPDERVLVHIGTEPFSFVGRFLFGGCAIERTKTGWTLHFQESRRCEIEPEHSGSSWQSPSFPPITEVRHD